MHDELHSGPSVSSQLCCSCLGLIILQGTTLTCRLQHAALTLQQVWSPRFVSLSAAMLYTDPAGQVYLWLPGAVRFVSPHVGCKHKATQVTKKSRTTEGER
jgi:hypothetical protein